MYVILNQAATTHLTYCMPTNTVWPREDKMLPKLNRCTNLPMTKWYTNLFPDLKLFEVIIYELYV